MNKTRSYSALWPHVSLADVAFVTMGQSPPGSTYNREGLGTPLVAGAGDLGDIHPEPTNWTSKPSHICQPGDIIYCIRATIGEMNWADRSYCLGRGVAGIRPNTNLIEPYYLFFLLGTLKERFLRLATGSTFVQIRRRDVETMQVPLPPLPEQQRIVAILRQADELRQLRRQANARAQQLLPALFDEMFSVNARNWSEQPLSYFADVNYGLTVNQRRRRSNDSYPYLRVANVRRWHIDLSDTAYIGILEGDIEKYRLQSGDVLVVEGHADPTQIGRAALWKGEDEVYLHQNHLLRIRPKLDRAIPAYLLGYINSEQGQQYMLRFAKTSSGLNTINSRVLLDMPIPHAPVELQMEFEQRYQHHTQLGATMSQATTSIKFLFESILNHAFIGELTEAWREQHREELAEAAAERDRLLSIESRPMAVQVASKGNAESWQNTMKDISAALEQLAEVNTQTVKAASTMSLPPPPNFIKLAKILQPNISEIAESLTIGLRTQLADLNKALVAGVADSLMSFTRIWRDQMQDFYADLAEKMTQMALVELDQPISGEMIQTFVFETAQGLPPYFTLYDLATDWRLNHLSHRELAEALDMLIVLGKIRAAQLKLESENPDDPYDLVDAYALVREVDLVTASSISL